MKGSVEKVYSDALFQLSLEEGRINEVFPELTAVSDIVEDNPELTTLLTAPTMTNEERLAVIESVFGGRISDITYNFLCVLVSKGRFGCLGAVCDKFKELYNDYANVADITVTTAVPLTDEQRQKLSERWSGVYNKTVIITEVVDKSLLGGIVVKYGNMLLDGSIRTRLEGMKQQIRNTIA